ncbi:hypothetical protein [Rhodanobacter denitrificans]|uniref:hypothetical protein n=1 Tax=Rhodanobacter denitrificans TaxID=666685 RepID=UPI001F34BC9B|nr:hypothetical protein [Rhodanobacter denitrificans]UJJ60623.1 hypothetical protein LRK55_19505 [Rhodanobacter denitrificans]
MKNVLRTAVLAIALTLGAAVALPTIATPISTSGMIAPTASYLAQPISVRPVIGHAFSGFGFGAHAVGAEGEPTNPCDPITPQNWCSCGGCS